MATKTTDKAKLLAAKRLPAKKRSAAPAAKKTAKITASPAAKKAAAKIAKANRAAKVEAICACGCGTGTKGRFAPGHDARYVSELVAELVGTKGNGKDIQVRIDKAVAQTSKAFSAALAAKLERAAQNAWARAK